LIEELEEDAASRAGFVRLWWHDKPARKIVGWARRWAYGTLLVVVTVQIFALIGTRLVEEMDRLDLEIRKVAAEKQLIPVVPDTERIWDDLDRQLNELERPRDANLELLSRWRRVALLLSDGIRTATGTTGGLAEEKEQGKRAGAKKPPLLTGEGELLRARMILQALSLHILPVLYGLLGASTFILRTITTELTASTFSATSIFRYRIRQGLGVILGLGVGLLPWNVGLVESQISLSSVALAFLAGYNVDAVFSVFDGWILRLQSSAAAKQAAAANARG
jgi:hypothetical protein